MGKIDKFSFFAGAFMVVLIIGCVAQIGGTDGVVRFQYLGSIPDANPQRSGQFAILDTQTGTVNIVYDDQSVGVFEFYVSAP